MNAAEWMFSLIRDVFEKPTDSIDDAVGEQLLPHLYRLSNAHDMAHIVAEALDRRGCLVGETASQFQKQRMLAVFRERQLTYETEVLFAALESAQIDFLPLKGTVLRAKYPEAWMRTSCDIDVLVRDADLDRASSVLTEQIGYRFVERGLHDVGFLSPRNVRVELHFDLVGENRAREASQLLRNVWEDATLCDGARFHYRMSDGMFYLYHVAHMAKHLEIGGCGIRPFLDLWMMDRDADADTVVLRDTMLERAGLKRFTDVSRRLAAVWFSGAVGDDLLTQLSDYVLRAGVYGTQEFRVAMGQAQKGGRWSYVWSRLFLSYERMRMQYPVLQKHKWLLPVCHIRRWMRLVFGGKAGRSLREVERTMHTSGDLTKKTAYLLEQLDLL